MATETIEPTTAAALAVPAVAIHRPYDAIVVGAGHNGLVTAAYLGKAGLRTLLLERRETTGGAAETSQLAPGVRVPTLAHTVGRLRPSIVRDLSLKGHRLSLVGPDVRVFAPGPDGRRSCSGATTPARRTVCEHDPATTPTPMPPSIVSFAR